MNRTGLYEDTKNGVTASFNTPELIYRKTRYAVKHGIGGVFVYHYACDVPANDRASLFRQITRTRNA